MDTSPDGNTILSSLHLAHLPLLSDLMLQLTDASFAATQCLWELRSKQLTENVWAEGKQNNLS